MKISIHVLAAILGLSVILSATGCTKRPVYIKDNTLHPVTLLDQQKVGVLSRMVYKHIYYVCEDTGTSLECKEACGGDSEYQCPSAFNKQPPWPRYATNQRSPMGSPGVSTSMAPVEEAAPEEEVAEEEGEEVSE